MTENIQMTLNEVITRIHPLPEACVQLLQAHITEVSLPKGHLLLKANRVEEVVYFVKKGIVRAFSVHDDNEITFWFGKEGDVVLSMKSYVARESAYESIELLEDCELYRVKTEALEMLYNSELSIANWGRKLAERELIKTEETLISRLFRTAAERYKALLEDSPHLVERVQLRHIASYLGITQVSLSRIRAEIR